MSQTITRLNEKKLKTFWQYIYILTWFIYTILSLTNWE